MDTAFNGEGARRYGGRWGSKGTALVYAAENLPLALLETLVGLTDYAQLYEYVFIRAHLTAGQAEHLTAGDLPDGWDERPPARATQQIGDLWAREQRSVALRVPSVVVPYSFNYVLNAQHPAFSELDIGEAETLPVDPQLAPS